MVQSFENSQCYYFDFITNWKSPKQRQENTSFGIYWVKKSNHPTPKLDMCKKRKDQSLRDVKRFIDVTTSVTGFVEKLEKSLTDRNSKHYCHKTVHRSEVECHRNISQFDPERWKMGDCCSRMDKQNNQAGAHMFTHTHWLSLFLSNP